MIFVRFYIETISLAKSLFYLITFPLHLVWYGIRATLKKVWLAFLSIGFIQRLWSPRFGTNWFSRFGRVFLIHFNMNMLVGGCLAGVAILFYLYQPMIRKFDGQYYLVVQQQGAPVVSAQEFPADSAANVLPSSMPIVTEVTPEPQLPVRVQTKFVAQEKLPEKFVPPVITNTGYNTPLHDPVCGDKLAQPCILKTTYFSSGHPGVDLAIPFGTPIFAVADGYVEAVGSTIWAYGNVVYVNHGNGVVSLYAHMSRIDVHVGQKVSKDTVIGAVGSTGHSSGPHLHLELHNNGAPFNPLGFLPGI